MPPPPTTRHIEPNRPSAIGRSRTELRTRHLTKPRVDPLRSNDGEVGSKPPINTARSRTISNAGFKPPPTARGVRSTPTPPTGPTYPIDSLAADRPPDRTEFRQPRAGSQCRRSALQQSDITQSEGPRNRWLDGTQYVRAMSEPVDADADDGNVYEIRPEPPQFDELIRRPALYSNDSPFRPPGPILRWFGSRRLRILFQAGLVAAFLAILVTALS